MKVTLRRKKLKGGAESLYLDIYHNGQRSYEFLDIKIDPKDKATKRKEQEEVAMLIKANRESDLLTSGTGYIPKRKRRVSFDSFFSNFIDSYKKKDLRMIKGAYGQFRAFSNEKTYQMSQITPALCKQFAEYLKGDAGLSGETPKNYFTRFKKVLSAATSEGYFKENPASKMGKMQWGDNDNLKKQILQADEMKLLLQTECGNDEVKKAFLFACNTGLGAAELRKLTYSEIANNRLKVKRAKVESQEIFIPLSKTALALIGERGKPNEKIFTLEQSDNAINKVLRYWTARAGIEKHITFYCGRHTFAVQLLLNGANLKTVADCMGHSSTKHTIKYLNFLDSLKVAAIDGLPDIFNS
jgi:site-specific recombinase XerD